MSLRHKQQEPDDYDRRFKSRWDEPPKANGYESDDMAEPRDIPERQRPEKAKANDHDVGRDLRDDDEPVAADNSEIALSDELVRRYDGRLRYVPKWGTFLVWDGAVWRKDEKREVATAARGIAAAASEALSEGKNAQAKVVAMRKTVAGIVGLTEIHAQVAASEDQWDQDDWLLNTPGAMFDLRTGAGRTNDPNAYCSMMTAVTPADKVPDDCLWLKVLNRILPSQVISYLQRGAGYSLTGSNKEQAFFFVNGPGGGAKTTVVGAMAGALGDYHAAAAPDTFVSSKFKDHPTDLAMLRGARFVTANETEEGRSWSEARIKAFTGGDKVTARFMNRDFFTYRQQGKIWITGNHKPRLRNVDHAMRRRLNLIPFSVTIPEHERDRNLEEKLKAEWPIVLRWMIDGCIEWQRIGLAPPDAVTTATEDYLSDENTVGQWLAERCEMEAGHRETSQHLWNSWKLWAEANGVQNPGSQKGLAGKLEAQGLVPHRGNKSRGFLGVRVVG